MLGSGAKPSTTIERGLDMVMPPYVANLREKVGHDLLWLPGATAIVLDSSSGQSEVLLVRRSDNNEWTPVSGISDPGEDPDITAVREVFEETTVRVQVDRVLWIQALPASEYVNGDQVQYFDVAFSCSRISGEARVGDDESSDVRWWRTDDLPPMDQRFVDMIRVASDGAPGVLLGTDRRHLN